MERRSFYDEIERNKRNSVILVICAIAALGLLGWFIGWYIDPSLSTFTVSFAVALALAMAWNSYYNSDKIVKSQMALEKATNQKYRRLHNIVEELCIAANLPKPEIYIIPSNDINAFATGRDPKHALIAVTRGALEKLDRDELEGVIAHELSHIRNYDMLFMTIVATLVGAAVILSNMFRYVRVERNKKSRGGIIIFAGIIGIILTPIIMKLIQLAVSRKREFLADSRAVEITRNPDGLASALEKIKKLNRNRMKVSGAFSHLFIAPTAIEEWFSTHPPIEERIKRLRGM